MHEQRGSAKGGAAHAATGGCDGDITFVLFTYNEEKRIGRAVRNFLGRGTVLVVDNESTDRTREIAERLGCEVMTNKNMGWVEDEVTTARVKAAVRTPWIYWGFADEMVGAETLAAIQAAARSGRYDIVNLARKHYYYGEFCDGAFCDRMNRIFKKDAIDFTGNSIHRFGRVAEGAKTLELPLQHFVHHFISNTAKTYLHTMDRYTDQECAEERPVPGILRLVLASAKLIVLNSRIRGGSKARVSSSYLVAQMLYYRWLSAMKLYEKASKLDRKMIEAKNDLHRDRILGRLG